MALEVGICCYCGGYCNPCSQSCGYCSRKLTGYALGWNSLDENLRQFVNIPKNNFKDELAKALSTVNKLPASQQEFFFIGAKLQRLVNDHLYEYNPNWGKIIADVICRMELE